MDLYVLLLPLRHNNVEEFIETNIVEILPILLEKYSISLDIYLESETRIYIQLVNPEQRKIIKYGLEDPVLLALFELSVYMMSIKDNRIYEKIYEGMGRIDPDTEQKRKSANLSELALKVAKGSESILNLRDATISEFKDLTNDFDIQELIDHKYDEDYIYIYSLKLKGLYENLVRLMSEYEEYSYLIDFKYLKDLMNTVSYKEDLNVSEVISMRLKTYIMKIRNHSNLQFILDTSCQKKGKKIAIVLTGNAHIPDYKFTLNSLGITSKVLNISEKEDILPQLFSKLKGSFEEFAL
jgi:hypothetical protein